MLKAGRSNPAQPTLGRFLNRDPIGFAGGLNLFAYVDGDPLNQVDPMGTWPEGIGPWNLQNVSQRRHKLRLLQSIARRAVQGNVIPLDQVGKPIHPRHWANLRHDLRNSTRINRIRHLGGRGGAASSQFLAGGAAVFLTGLGTFLNVSNIRCQRAIERFLEKEKEIRTGVCPGRLSEEKIRELLLATNEYFDMFYECRTPGVFSGAKRYVRSQRER